MTVLYPPAPDPLATTPRYTTVEAVRQAMGIDDPNIDDEILLAIVSAEYHIDVFLNTSYPQDADPNAGTDDALDPAPIEGIPETLGKAALLASIKLTKLNDTATGSFGADNFELVQDDPFTALRSVFPLLMGLKRGWGLH